MKRPHPTRPLSRELFGSIVGVAILAVSLFTVPLAYMILANTYSNAVQQLSIESARVLALTGDSKIKSGEALPAALNPDVRLGLYGPQGQRISGSGEQIDTDARVTQAANGAEIVRENGEVALYQAFAAEDRAPVVVRASYPMSAIGFDVARQWFLLFLLGVLVVVVAGLVARRRSRALSKPFEQLAQTASDLGRGVFVLEPPRTGIEEADEVSDVLAGAAARLGSQLERQQRFAQDASHQLRTPLAAAQLDLEVALAMPDGDLHTAVDACLGQLGQLDKTVTELLALAAPERSTQSCDAALIATAVIRRWAPIAQRAGRSLRLVPSDQDAVVAVSEGAVDQVLEILIDNALKHGQGDIVVTMRELAGWVAIDVADDGAIHSGVVEHIFTRGYSNNADGTGRGIGLSLAKSLLGAEGARINLTCTADPVRFTIVLPGTVLPSTGLGDTALAGEMTASREGKSGIEDDQSG